MNTREKLASTSTTSHVRTYTVAVVGLGYVGLPLAVEFGSRMPTIGFDTSPAKIEAYRQLRDPTGEVGTERLKRAAQLRVTSDASELTAAEILIVAVPTPVDDANLPDFGPLASACRMVGPHLREGAIVVFESTVYPGATEEICIPHLESSSGKKWKKDFFVGYSPERINPGDKEHTLTKIVKVVSGDTPETLERVAELYSKVIDAGIHKVRSIRVAEAAKVIENTQRDLNIALMNELAVIFHRMGIDTGEVLEAAGTKWNFLRFKPGLVGGHCIGVDPYYLTHAAEKAGYHPDVILAGRRINDSMGRFVGQQTVKSMIACGSQIQGGTVVVLGLTFKEDCPDIRNSKVVDVIEELKSFGLRVVIHDPAADEAEAEQEYGLTLSSWGDLPRAGALVMAVAHREYRALPSHELLAKLLPNAPIIDVKSIIDREQFEAAGHKVWRL